MDTRNETPDRPSLLYITPVLPAETGNGLAMRAAAVLRLLCRAYSVSLLVAPLYGSGLATVLPGWVERECAAVRSLTAGAEPSAWAAATRAAFGAQQFDIVHVFRLATLSLIRPLLDEPPCRSARLQLDLDDVESRTQAGLAALYARHGMEGERAEAEQRAAAAALEESRLLRELDSVFVCSEHDRAELTQRIADGRGNVVVLPNVVTVPAEPLPVPAGLPRTILFVGTFGYFPNADAAIWFCREALPVIRERSAAPFRVILAGTGAPPEVRDLAHIPEVQYFGPIADIVDAYRQSDLVVVPLRAGGGTRIKLLEALAQPRPVVSTAFGADGLELEDARDLLIANRAHHFAEQCLRLLADPELAEELGEHGRAVVRQRYTPDALIRDASAWLAPRSR